MKEADMTYEEMTESIRDYDFSDDFILAEKILTSPLCDLALALKIFYLANGYEFLKDPTGHSGGEARWLFFMSTLKKDIESGTFKNEGRPFRVPLTRNQKAGLRKMRIRDIFLTDIQ